MVKENDDLLEECGQEELYPEPLFGECYAEAWRFLLREEEGVLVHGRVFAGAPLQPINHAWVELPTGFIWEPSSQSLIKIDEFKSAFKPEEDYRYDIKQAAIMATRTRNLGPWTKEERGEFLKKGGVK